VKEKIKNFEKKNTNFLNQKKKKMILDIKMMMRRMMKMMIIMEMVNQLRKAINLLGNQRKVPKIIKKYNNHKNPILIASLNLLEESFFSIRNSKMKVTTKKLLLKASNNMNNSHEKLKSNKNFKNQQIFLHQKKMNPKRIDHLNST